MIGPWVYVIALFVIIGTSALLARYRPVRSRFPARPESVRAITSLTSDLAREACLSEAAIHDCRLALDEACTNIIRHAYGNNPRGEIEITIQVHRGFCAIHLTDFGDSYFPEMIPLPRRGAPLDEAQPGGLGLYLMRQVMDEVRYTPGVTSNTLVMVKREYMSAP
jgi:serine/threonine-protein kinase RsbW